MPSATRDSPDGLRVTTTTDEDVFLISLYGAVDLATVGQVREATTAAIASGRSRVVLDMGACHFIDSTGLGAVMALDRRTRGAGQRLLILPGGRAVSRIFEISGLADQLPIARDDA